MCGWSARADAVIIATPGYHGGMSGLVKNAIDHLEALRDDERPYLDGRAVGVIVAAAGWQACGTTLVSVRSAVHALRGWPTPFGVTVNSAEQHPVPTGASTSGSRAALRILAEQLTDVRAAGGLARWLRCVDPEAALLDDQAAVLDVEQSGVLAIRAALCRAMCSCSHSALAPAATAWRAMSGVDSDGRNTSTSPTCSGTSASVR